MIGNKLSVNPDKTEYLLFNSKNINVPVCINLNLNTNSPSECAKNLGVIFQSDRSMDKHISSVVKTCFHQLREFRHIRSFIPKSAAIIFANVFIHSRIDYCNSLFYGLPKYSIHRLQKNTKLSCSYYYSYLSFITYHSNSQIFILATSSIPY